jgi:hypothetical protein
MAKQRMPNRRKKDDSKDFPVASAVEVRHLTGPVGDDTISAILKLGASLEELEAAATYARGEGDYIDRLGHPMSGKVGQIYDILIADELYTNSDR